MRRGRPTLPVTLTLEERDTLERWSRRPKTAQALAQRARIVLGCAAGETHTALAGHLRMTKQTVGKWRARFLATRLDGLLDEPRPGAPRTITDAMVERVLTQTLETTPPDATHWSTRSLAKACGLSRSTVHRIWRAFALQPHRTETFKLSKDPLFIEKVRDIVGLYLNPPDRALVQDPPSLPPAPLSSWCHIARSVACSASSTISMNPSSWTRDHSSAYTREASTLLSSRSISVVISGW
jgi:hypothetical protein